MPRPTPSHAAKPDKVHPGWLILTVDDVETALPPGKAVRLASVLVPDSGVTVDAVREAWPNDLEVGTTGDGLRVALRSQVAPDEDEDEPVPTPEPTPPA